MPTSRTFPVSQHKEYTQSTDRCKSIVRRLLRRPRPHPPVRRPKGPGQPHGLHLLRLPAPVRRPAAARRLGHRRLRRLPRRVPLAPRQRHLLRVPERRLLEPVRPPPRRAVRGRPSWGGAVRCSRGDCGGERGGGVDGCGGYQDCY